MTSVDKAASLRLAADELERAHQEGREFGAPLWWWLRDRADELDGGGFQQCPHEAIRATCPNPCGCNCGRTPCRPSSKANLLNCPVCGSGEEGDCICDLAESFARADWEASGRAIYESPWEQVSPMKKRHLRIKALPEAREFLSGHTQDHCRPELCGGSKIDPCEKAVR